MGYPVFKKAHKIYTCLKDFTNPLGERSLHDIDSKIRKCWIICFKSVFLSLSEKTASFMTHNNISESTPKSLYLEDHWVFVGRSLRNRCDMSNEVQHRVPCTTVMRGCENVLSPTSRLRNQRILDRGP